MRGTVALAMWLSIAHIACVTPAPAPSPAVPPRVITPEPAAPVAKDIVFRDGAQSWTYRELDAAGFVVYVETELLPRQKLIADLMTELRNSCTIIAERVHPEVVALLRKIPIWVSDEPHYPFRPGERGVIPFHRSAQWLREHRLNPHMQAGVHVINPAAVLYDHRVFEWGPMTILHEMSHGYHMLHLGQSNPDITAAYLGAMAKGLYKKVPDRGDPSKLVPAYAATNDSEYFAELTEAFFGINDWTPKDRESLRKYDPVGYELIRRLWRAK